MHTAPVHFFAELGVYTWPNGRKFKVGISLNIETKAQLRAAGRLCAKASYSTQGRTRLQAGLLEFIAIELITKGKP